jgi:ribosomal-protein-alanine N-acetyltransferase
VIGDDVAMRPLRHADLDIVEELERGLFGAAAWSRDVYETELAEPGRRYVAAVDARGDLVGYAGIALAQDAEIMTIGVVPAWRRRGVGARLLETLLEAARAGRSRRVFLEVRTSDDGARRLYERAGFRPVGVRRGYYQPENADALVMRLELARAVPVGAEVPPSTEEDL